MTTNTTINVGDRFRLRSGRIEHIAARVPQAVYGGSTIGSMCGTWEFAQDARPAEPGRSLCGKCERRRARRQKETF